MRRARKHSPRSNHGKRESLQLLLLVILMALAILYGLYIGLWSLHKEEEKESGARTLLEVPPSFVVVELRGSPLHTWHKAKR